MTRRRVSAVFLVALFVVAGCRTGDATGPVGSGATSSSGPGPSTDVLDSLAPEATEPEGTGPVSTSIPGFDGWLVVNPGAVNLGATEAGFAMTLTRRAPWSGSSRGVLFYTTFDGDFRLTATVRATRTSDSSQDPGGDGTTQLAGLMARRDGSTESWVLLEVGGAAKGLVVATDSTVAGSGRLVASGWNDNEADLKICRTGTTFTFWKRAADSDDDWAAVGQVARNDLAGTLQIGATLSADATPDLTGFFDNLTLEPMDPGEDC